MPIVSATEISSREQFGDLCNARNARVAVEIGCEIGLFAEQFMLRAHSVDRLFCIDSYRVYEWLPEDRTADIISAVLRLQQFNGRARLLLDTSAAVAERFPQYYRDVLDFVYVDAMHTQKGCASDIDLWWPILQPGGILAGHDYDDLHPGVMRAVEEFMLREGLTVHVLDEEPCSSWYVIKP